MRTETGGIEWRVDEEERVEEICAEGHQVSRHSVVGQLFWKSIVLICNSKQGGIAIDGETLQKRDGQHSAYRQVFKRRGP